MNPLNKGRADTNVGALGKWTVKEEVFVLFDLILYVSSTIF